MDDRFNPEEMLWIEYYFIEVDAVLAIPVRPTRPALNAINKGQVTVCIAKRAEELNTAFENEGPWAKNFLQEKLEARWQIITHQKEQAA